MKKLSFLIQICEVHIKTYNIGHFQDLRVSATKMAAVLI